MVEAPAAANQSSVQDASAGLHLMRWIEPVPLPRFCIRPKKLAARQKKKKEKEINMKSRFLMLLTAITLFAMLVHPARATRRTTHLAHHHIPTDRPGDIWRTIQLPSNRQRSKGAPNQVVTARGAVGWADTSTPDPYAPNCFNFDCSYPPSSRFPMAERHQD